MNEDRLYALAESIFASCMFEDMDFADHMDLSKVDILRLHEELKILEREGCMSLLDALALLVMNGQDNLATYVALSEDSH